jgi:hypothetical protein
VVAPLKAELQRTKEAFNKERQVRNKVLQENAALKEQGVQYERIIQQLQEQCSINSRVIPEQKEQLEQARAELGRVRQQARTSNEKLVRKIRELQQNISPAVIGERVHIVECCLFVCVLEVLDVCFQHCTIDGPDPDSVMINYHVCVQKA